VPRRVGRFKPLLAVTEVQSILTRALEQSPIGHAVFTEGKTKGTPEEAIQLLYALAASHGDALLRIASEVDELEAAISGG